MIVVEEASLKTTRMIRYLFFLNGLVPYWQRHTYLTNSSTKLKRKIKKNQIRQIKQNKQKEGKEADPGG